MTRHKISVAPMLDCTDRHFRLLMRKITRCTLLYTEMLMIKEVLAAREENLAIDPIESPIALQLGGSHPKELAQCAHKAQNLGYDEINLNVGCPSDRVQQGEIGACLMRKPKLVADCIAQIQSKVTLPVTVKCRLGVDHHDSYADLVDFVETVSSAGCKTFIIHARKAWLKGLSPKQNREIPPLDYEKVYQIKRDYPHLDIHINGGITTLPEVQNHLERVDGVMLGRAVYHQPYLLMGVDQLFYDQKTDFKSEEEIIGEYGDYMAAQIKRGIKLSAMTRHLLGLFRSRPGSKGWRRYLSTQSHRSGAGIEILQSAMKQLLQVTD